MGNVILVDVVSYPLAVVGDDTVNTADPVLQSVSVVKKDGLNV